MGYFGKTKCFGGTPEYNGGWQVKLDKFHNKGQRVETQADIIKIANTISRSAMHKFLLWQL